MKASQFFIFLQSLMFLAIVSVSMYCYTMAVSAEWSWAQRHRCIMTAHRKPWHQASLTNIIYALMYHAMMFSTGVQDWSNSLLQFRQSPFRFRVHTSITWSVWRGKMVQRQRKRKTYRKPHLLERHWENLAPQPPSSPNTLNHDIIALHSFRFDAIIQKCMVDEGGV